MVKVQEEICFTIQSIARAFVKLGKRDLAIKEYSECIERMREIKEQCWSNGASSLSPKGFLDESICELSAFYTYQASTLFTAWTEGGLSAKRSAQDQRLTWSHVILTLALHLMWEGKP